LEPKSSSGLRCRSIVFSSWKKTLDLAAQLLELYDMRYDVIHGGLSLTKRLKVLGDFKSPTGRSILLMTLGTGAVGLVASICIYSRLIADIYHV
jgi:SWI/SNF-related matrix-associated actin-dependent regulator of chromatin subfamily A3